MKKLSSPSRYVMVMWLIFMCCHAQVHRDLAVGDFEEVNQLLNGAMIRLPDARVETNVITVDMTNVRCTDFQIDDILLSAMQESDFVGDTRLQVSIEGLLMHCFLDYKYTFIFTRYGEADLYSSNNRASVSMLFKSPDYSGGTFYPTESIVEQCFPEVNIDDLDFRGDVAAFVLNTIERLLRDKVEEQAERQMCEELQSLSQTLVSDVLKGVDRRLEEYMAAPPSDPLRSENALIVPESIKIVDFQDKTTWKKWLDQMLDDAMTFLTKRVEDDANGNDMNINALIREHFLDENGSFLLDVGGDLTLYQGHDQFLQSTILLESIKLVGLDTLTSFEPLVDVGRYTLQNEFSFRYLTMEVDLIMELKASTRPDSIFVDNDGSGISEKVTVKFGVEDLNATAAILLAVDESKLGEVSIGSLLDVDNIFGCFLSTLFGVQWSGLSVAVGNMQPPTLEGFVSPGIDRIVTKSVDAAFLMYKRAMLNAAPGFFQLAVTDFLNKKFSAIFPANVDLGNQCNPASFAFTESGYVDFRDLLLSPTDAKEAGGLGTQPYGDVVYTIVSELREEFLANDADGSPKLNSLIRDFLGKSNTTGVGVSSVGDLLNYTTTLAMGGFQADLLFRIFDTQITNLDTIGPPVQLLEPVSGEANVLNSSLSIGVDSKPVRLSSKLLISLSDGAGLQLRNEVGINLDLSSARVGLILLLQILEQPFFAVPLRDTLNLNCWLTTILPTSPDSNPVVLQNHTISVEDLSLDIACVSCSSPKFDALIDLLYSKDTKSKVFNFMNLILESDYLRTAAVGFVRTASKQCPHTEEYDPDSSWGDFVKDAFGGFGVVGATRDEKAKYFNIALALITIFCVLIFIGVKWIAKRKNRSLMESLPSEASYRLRLKEDEEQDKQSELNKMTESMFRSPELPRHVRLLVPFVLLFTIGLVLVGHLGLLATVNVTGSFAGETYAVSDVLELSFISAAIRTFDNGGLEVAILLFLFTGVWLAKLFTSLALWFLPPRKLSVSRRGTVFLWLDVFAKLSLPDIFMMLLAVGALMLFIGGVDKALVVEEDFFSAKLIVVPGAGFYCIIIAQRITRVTSRYLLDCHQEIINSAIRELKQSEEWIMRASGRTGETWIEDDEESRLSDSARRSDDLFSDEAQPPVDSDSISSALRSSDENHAQQPRSPIGRAKRMASASIRRPIAVGFIALTVLALIVIACVFVPAISIDTKVVWGLLGTGKTFEEAVNEYGMFWMLSSILLQSRFVLDSVEDYVGLGFLLALVIITSLASPIMKGITTLRRWNQQRRERNSRTTSSTRKKAKRKADVSLRTKISSALSQWLRGNKQAEKDSEFLPACRLKAWNDLHVYICAFVVGCWQLGAVAGYAIHIYCFILEKVYDIVAYLGLMEKTTCQCYRVQASSPTFVIIVFMSFFLLSASFLLQASVQYRKTMTQTAAEMKGIEPSTTAEGKDQRDSVTRPKNNVADDECSEIEESTRTDATDFVRSSSFRCQ